MNIEKLRNFIQSLFSMFKKSVFIASFLFLNPNINTANACIYGSPPTLSERLWGSSLALHGQVITLKPIENEDYYEVIFKVSKVWNSDPNDRLGLYKRYVFKIHSNYIHPPAPTYCIRSYETIEKYGYYIFSIKEDESAKLPLGVKIKQVDSAKDFRWLTSLTSVYRDYVNPDFMNLYIEHWTEEGHLYDPLITGSNLTHKIFKENK